jgi:DNA polymerase V
MTGTGIHSGDLLIVDLAVEATSGRVVAAVDGELTSKRLIQRQGKVLLQAEHPNYPPLLIQEHTNCTIWGVVIYAIHHVR